jgi:hypothetical protein
MIKTFSDAKALMAEIEARRAEADAAADGWQKAIRFGDYFVRLCEEELVIYGEILDPAPEPELDVEMMGDEERMEYEYERDLYKRPHMLNVRFTRCFSRLCPDGELGDTHVRTMNAKLTKAQFDKAREAGWPCDPREVLTLLGHNLPHHQE